MSVLTGVGILLLSMLIVVFMQMTPSILSIFLHYGSAKYSKNRVSDMAIFYLIGAETAIALIFVLLYYAVSKVLVFLPTSAINIVSYTFAGIMIILGVLFPFVYFKKGNGTRLFIRRNTAENYIKATKKAKTRSDMFMLGMAAGLPELVFTLPVYVLATIIIIQLGSTAISRSAMILLFMLAAVLPLAIIRIMFARHYNLASIQKLRVKNKPFFMITISLSFILIALLLIMGSLR